ncbi:DUF4097 family beta strand repeat-containing protein [Neolewinella litorea]|uniref:DUF4097 domain-containing protein n=1 Tax=Neolewinella litorea TaxID=2562452 RepID=A0A4V3XKD1_9BACT|nr:DUF4097 family beta strand repeat-containing protein [Neolewinella litorea]THH36503.1 hypothetical protein E4021_14650 [Neolewinella litorea]
MKVKLTLLLALFVLALPAFALSRPGTVFEKKLSETFPIRNDGQVRLDNRYGEIKVVTWSQPRVQIDVLIRVEARDKDEFQDVLKRIDVSLSGGNNLVSAVTTINSSRSSGSWWSLLTNSGSSNDFKIFYTVNMPPSVGLEVDARYCDVELPNLTGTTNLDVGYGDLVAGRLSGQGLVDVSYGSARIERLGANSTVKLRYSEGTIRNAGDLRYDGRYSEARFGTVGVLRLDVGYDEIEVESAESVYLNGNYNELSVGQARAIYLNGNYTDYNLGTVTGILELEGNYGDLKVERLAAGFERVDIRVNYSDVQINVDDSAGYTLDLSARYGDIDVPTDALSPRDVRSEGSSKSVKGKKSGTGSGLIKIATTYGDIEIY